MISATVLIFLMKFLHFSTIWLGKNCSFFYWLTWLKFTPAIPFDKWIWLIPPAWLNYFLDCKLRKSQVTNVFTYSLFWYFVKGYCWSKFLLHATYGSWHLRCSFSYPLQATCIYCGPVLHDTLVYIGSLPVNADQNVAKRKS